MLRDVSTLSGLIVATDVHVVWQLYEVVHDSHMITGTHVVHTCRIGELKMKKYRRPLAELKIKCCCANIQGLHVYRIVEIFSVVQNFAIFADRSASAKIKTAKITASTISIAPCLPVCAGTAKIKTTNISSDALRGDSAKFCTCENFPLNFPLYGITHVYILCMYICIYQHCMM